MVRRAIEANTYDVEGITGVTVTSDGFKRALRSAISRYPGQGWGGNYSGTVTGTARSFLHSTQSQPSSGMFTVNVTLDNGVINAITHTDSGMSTGRAVELNAIIAKAIANNSFDSSFLDANTRISDSIGNFLLAGRRALDTIPGVTDVHGSMADIPNPNP
jgi:hypothetical protein